MSIRITHILPLILLAVTLSFAQCNGQPTTFTAKNVQVESRRLVKSGPGVGLFHPFYADISADGNLWALHSNVIEDVSVHDFRTGTKTKLYTSAFDSGHIETMRFSKDGKQIAFADCCMPGYVLRVGTTDGSQSRIVLTGEQVAEWNGASLDYLVPVDWVGSDIVLTLISYNQKPGDPDKNYFALVEVSVESGAISTFRDDVGVFPFRTRLSPDGTKALIGPEGVRLVDQASGTETVIEEAGYPLGWSEDGQHIFYVTASGPVIGEPGSITLDNLIRRTVRGDGSLGQVEMLATNLGRKQPFAVAQDRVYMFIPTETTKMEMISIDLDEGRALSNPSSLSDGRIMLGAGRTTAWSADGLRIAFLEGGSDPDTDQVVVTRSTAGNNRREYSIPPETGISYFAVVRWHPNNEALYLGAAVGEIGQGVSAHLVRLNLNTGVFQDLGSMGRPSVFNVSNDGDTVYILRQKGIAAVTPDRHTGPNGSSRAEGVACSQDPSDMQALQVGDCRTVTDFGEETADDLSKACRQGSWDLALSPDGETLAVSTPSCVGTVPEAGGSIAWLVERRVDDGPVVNWTPDGTGLVYQRQTEALSDDSASEDRLVVFDLDSGVERVVLEMDHMRAPRLSPDGSRISYLGGENVTELWVMEEVK